MSKITLKEAKRKYGLTRAWYDNAETWKELSQLPLPEELIREAADKVYWYKVSFFSKLSEDFIREFKDYVNWYWISERQKLSEEFVNEFRDKVKWYTVSKYQKISEDFIKKFKDKIDWDYISTYQKLSEPFIREMQDYVNWYYISKYQPLSEDFIREFADKVNWCYISRYQMASKEFLEEFGYELCNNSDKPESYWKERVQETGLYECHKNYFYAYKGIRNDRYSKYNFQYQYLPGEIYECFSDYSDNENSFGLSAWTKEDATDYCDELVVKVKVCYKDVTAVVHNGGKIRCKRLTVME